MTLSEIAEYLENYINSKIEEKLNEILTKDTGELIEITKPNTELKVTEINNQVIEDEM